MLFYSTKNIQITASFREAVLNGIAPDGGLYLPTEFPDLSGNFMEDLGNISFEELAYIISSKFIDDIPGADLQNIVQEIFNFDVPLIHLDEKLSILELFHGPTMAFKDFGARFLSRILARYIENESKKTIILVATSGDTGSAVANGFYGIDGIEVGLLYPSNKVSNIQEKQLTTMGGNIHAFEVAGTFDDCQNLVKGAFLDDDLSKKFFLSSANSINIARLLPQSFYYFYSFGS